MYLNRKEQNCTAGGFQIFNPQKDLKQSPWKPDETTSLSR